MEEKKLTDEEIVKALECKVGGCMICESVNAGCPYDMKSYCDHEKHLKDILDLIHRLQDENEAWRLKSKELETAWEISSSNEEKLQKQVDELKNNLNRLIVIGIYDSAYWCEVMIDGKVFTRDDKEHELIKLIREEPYSYNIENVAQEYKRSVLEVSDGSIRFYKYNEVE